MSAIPKRGPHAGGAPRTRQVADVLLVFVGSTTPTTAAVARQFGWTTQRAARELAALRDEGLVASRWEHQRSGSMNRWRLA